MYKYKETNFFLQIQIFRATRYKKRGKDAHFEEELPRSSTLVYEHRHTVTNHHLKNVQNFNTNFNLNSKYNFVSIFLTKENYNCYPSIHVPMPVA